MVFVSSPGFFTRFIEPKRWSHRHITGPSLAASAATATWWCNLTSLTGERDIYMYIYHSKSSILYVKHDLSVNMFFYICTKNFAKSIFLCFPQPTLWTLVPYHRHKLPISTCLMGAVVRVEILARITFSISQNEHISICGWGPFQNWNRSSSPQKKISIRKVTNIPTINGGGVYR